MPNGLNDLPAGYRWSFAPDGSRTMVPDAPVQGMSDAEAAGLTPQERAAGDRHARNLYGGRPQTPTGMLYVDPNTGQVKGQNQGTDFTSESRPGLANALGDSESDMSKLYYYGGDRGAANREWGRQTGLAYGYRNRGDIAADMSRTNESAALQGGLASGLQRYIAGNQASPAQQQLQSGYQAANAGLQSGAVSTRGGLGARALANRTAGNEMAENAGRARVAAGELQVREQNAAMGQLAGTAAAQRQNWQNEAFGQADLAMQSRQLNTNAEMRSQRRALDVAGLGLQGEMARQGARHDILASNVGQENIMGQRNVARSEEDLKATMGGIRDAASGSGQILQRNGWQPGPEPSFFQKNPDYKWDR